MNEPKSFFDDVENPTGKGITYDYFISFFRVGEDRALSSNDLASLMGIAYGGSEVYFRGLVREAIMKHGALIGSCPNGYYIIKTKQELWDNLERLYFRMEGIQHRYDALKRNGEDLP